MEQAACREKRKPQAFLPAMRCQDGARGFGLTVCGSAQRRRLESLRGATRDVGHRGKFRVPQPDRVFREDF